MEETKPKFIHDCDCCKFLGTYNNHDLYFCGPGNHQFHDTIIARWGDDGPNYSSGICFGRDKKFGERYTDRYRALRIAFLIADDLGLIHPKAF